MSETNDIIENASYCVLVNIRSPERHEAQFYDIDGLPLKQIPLGRSEWWYDHIERFDKMLDRRVVGKARPAKVVIDHCPKRGRSAWFYDRNGNLIDWVKYMGPADIDSIATILKPCPCDRVWMMTHNIPVIDYTIEKSTICAIL